MVQVLNEKCFGLLLSLIHSNSICWAILDPQKNTALNVERTVFFALLIDSQRMQQVPGCAFCALSGVLPGYQLFRSATFPLLFQG